MAKERYQNPVLGDTINLRLVSINSNNFSNLSSIDKVEIYHIDKCDKNCPTSGTLIETISSGDVQNDATGQYYVQITPTSPTYPVGEFSDVWYLTTPNSQSGKASKYFKIYTDLWYFGTLPPVYNFDFRFGPNRFRKGDKKYITIQIIPNIPKASDLIDFYENIAVVGDVAVSIEQACGPCVPKEEDLRLIVDKEQVVFREKAYGYYYLDTTDMECGIYNIWFDFDFANIHDISQKFQIQIY